MSNWRINFGLGPLRYTRGINAPKTKKKGSAVGVIITLLVVLGAIYLCCWGGVAWMNSQQS